MELPQPFPAPQGCCGGQVAVVVVGGDAVCHGFPSEVESPGLVGLPFE